ncbi:DExH-box ATP-dependent RNA helicase DExH6 [Drosophila grimshawi]|uniref:GH25306 n=1 Tax=Drosophila grimshawi TaxID=7222 RepID=B4K1W9_DROGR|nr:DExH-box ATP-dependent RNA helicase DExH6 [Drosophila grimshawi]EDW05063.1 GH25306 [Drosophila grimshawi]
MSEPKKISVEELNLLQQIVFDFLKSDEETKEISGFSDSQRKEIHLLARHHELRTRSRSSAGSRILTLSRSKSASSMLLRQQIILFFSTESNSILDCAVKNLELRSDPLSMQQPQQRHGRVLQYGGLLGMPRIPPRPRDTSARLDAERRDLPIFMKRGKIFQVLETSQVLIVNGATGSGKSTQLPQYLLENATATNQPIRIVVSQPRRIAAISVSGRIAEERNESLGDTVGYIIRMESQYSNNTVLSFTTSGCLLRTLVMNGAEFFASTTHLVIDEVHDRDLNTDFLLLASKLELQRNKSLKLILMSATMDLEALSKYFGNAPIIDVEGRSFNVRTFALEDVLKISGYMTREMLSCLGSNADNADNATTTDILNAYERKAQDMSRDIIDNALVVSLVQMLLMRGSKGAVIIFLPGYQDMTKLMDIMSESLPSNVIKILLMHSQVDSCSQNDVFTEYPNVQLKIVLSTNIGQTSITIPDLLYVIDTGRVKMKTYNPTTGASQLDCVWISKADAQQRMGRAGRRCDGICYRLYSNNTYESFHRFPIPEIIRQTLDEVCLLAKIAMPTQDIQQFLAQALDPPQSVAVAQSCAKLKLLNVLLDSDESVTELGYIISELPLDVQLGKCLVYGVYYQCTDSLIIITAYYSVRNPFTLSSDRSSRNQQRKPRDFFSFEGFSDSIGILELYHQYKAALKKGVGEANKFCERNCLCGKSMDLFDSAVHTLRATVKRIFKIRDLKAANQFNTNLNMVRLALAAGLYPKLVYLDKSKITRLIEEGDPRVQLSRNSCLSICSSKKYKSEWIIYVEKSSTAGLFSYIEHATLVSTLMVALQCGKVIKLESIETTFPEDIDGDYVKQSYLILDSKLRIQLDTESGKKLLQLRSNIDREFAKLVGRRIVDTAWCPSVSYVQKLLKLDFEYSGLSDNDLVF